MKTCLDISLLKLLTQFTWGQRVHGGQLCLHSASDTYPTMHRFVTGYCTCVHISVTELCIVGYGTGVL